jgi:glucose uptake protein
MFIPQTYSSALFLMTLSMLCWGTWANTQKITRTWPFELYYFDYTVGLLVVSLIIGPTLCRIDPSSPESFVLNLRAASPRAVWLVFAGGAVFSVGNILIVAAISVAGMAVSDVVVQPQNPEWLYGPATEWILSPGRVQY